MLVSQLVASTLSAALAALAWGGLAPVWVVMVCSLGLGVVSAFAAPASQALISDLVPRSQLQSAVALNSMTYNLARAVGPALAALSVRKLGIPASFAINSGSYLVLVSASCSSSRPRGCSRPGARPGFARASSSRSPHSRPPARSTSYSAIIDR